ncbi:siderophore-interacting protein [Leucobacter massiliensis]|uniref:NADPH-dependent ferric siderophore reductase n=1 Tax=Leucobacter massiliensis TaxID=1686285 RepID=A0A2S9QRJ1_9MICO|nr:siderophore-interacting protein [Leucobacter massiliensis]PRI12200.1 NADPH-dependent ferric siderophore reductase [Leucobacter massiliensis]
MESPFGVARARVERVERVSPSFARITLGGDALRAFGNPERTLDQRIKLIFPPGDGVLPELRDSGEWYAEWLALPEEQRGSMRTYSIRRIELEPDGATRFVIDFVLHLADGATGPASLWASRARPGQELLVVAPRRGRLDGGGIEFEPAGARDLLLAGDETAAPAIARILEELPRDARGAAFIEVPLAEDRLAIDAPAGVELRWLARGPGDAHGAELIPGVMAYLGREPVADALVTELPRSEGVAADALLWETPAFSALGEDIVEPAEQGGAESARYHWIAGESSVVTSLRRHLVKELGIPRSRVAFMGYWRRGVAMKG